MKKYIILLIVLASCTKSTHCYKCTVTNYQNGFPGNVATSENDYCGWTQTDANNYVASHTQNATAFNTTASCRRSD